jgi:hypothetical protein
MLENPNQQNSAGGNSPAGFEYTKHQKIAAGSLAVFGVFIMIFWFVQLKKSIHDPLSYADSSGSPAQSQNCPNGDCSQADAVALKTKDTDKDGISDYDEINNYKTSPFLEDTDSDGKTDSEELKSGTDPNCPEGRECNSNLLYNADENIQPENSASGTDDIAGTGLVIPDILLPGSGQSVGSPAGVAETSGDDYQKLISGTIDAAALRKLLISSGMDPEQLKKISNEQLMKSYKEMKSVKN